MKARVKATGNIVEATLIHGDNGKLWYEIDKSGYCLTDEELDFSFEREPDYWTRLEHQYAGMAMQGMLNNSLLITSLLKVNKSHEDIVAEVTGTAIRYAHALVEKLKTE